eukprot:3165623-Pyramimonas_sp.AAC.1
MEGGAGESRKSTREKFYLWKRTRCNSICSEPFCWLATDVSNDPACEVYNRTSRTPAGVAF